MQFKASAPLAKNNADKRPFKKIIILSSLILVMITIITIIEISAKNKPNTIPRQVIGLDRQVAEQTIEKRKNYFLMIYDYFIKGQRELHHMMSNI